MNKVVAMAVMSVALSGAGVAQAESPLGQQFTECKAQLANIYGDDTRMRLDGKAPGRGTILKLRVYPEGQGVTRVHCTRDVDGELSFVDQHGMALVPAKQDEDALSAL
ncbi:hypothetical protein A3709_07865 [Halioglobus sp. HI00S01]|uniref:hypothetical protein n=1 Tax=Halioglobus sp. HI00S01 TaxID=1822214 RepID=UPI0007C35BDD|nr:hypothetical protein [Halioglobus sp. HI00S01]KZX54921.1 hypothetical protein A3709_07865 [Halioglobus sp. HI00S01]